MANLYVFHQGQGLGASAELLWYFSYDGTTWTADQQIQNLQLSESPSAVAWKGGIAVFHQAGRLTGEVWYTYSPDGRQWGTTQTDAKVPIDVGMLGSPSAVVYNGILYVFHQGLNDNGLWYFTYDGTTWTADQQIQHVGMSESPSAVVWKGGIAVFHQGQKENGQVWYTYSPDGRQWGTTQTDAKVPLDAGMSGSPSAVVYNGILYVFHQGQKENGQLWYFTYDGTTWTADQQIQHVGMSESPSAVAWKGGIAVFHQGSHQSAEVWYTYSPDGRSWGTTQTDAKVPLDVSMFRSPSCVVI
jgi:hypothetical protein